MNSSLFDEFKPVSPKEWKQKIQVDLKGADYNDTLLWKTEEGIIVRPFYTKEDRTHQEVKTPKNTFNICQNIFIDDESIANTLAKNAIKQGATAINFSANTTFDYKKALAGIKLETILIYFNFSFLLPEFITKIHNYCNSKTVYFNTDIIGNLAKTGNWYTNLKADHKALKQITSSTNNCIHVNTSIYQNAGANIVQQLAYGLAHANEYLNILDENITDKIHFSFSVGSNYFFEIAKLRAFRILWASLLKEYKKEDSIAHIFSQPTLRNKTLYDCNINMLRTTSECMSSILGGSTTISNVSYNTIFRKSNKLGEQAALNQLLILQKERGFSNAQNIANGAYYIESITTQLAEKALEVFKLIENGGGFLKQLKEGIIQRKIKESADNEQLLFDKNELVLLGTNKNQDFNEKIKNNLDLYPFVKSRFEKTLIQPIIQKRLAEKLEQERLKNE